MQQQLLFVLVLERLKRRQHLLLPWLRDGLLLPQLLLLLLLLCLRWRRWRLGWRLGWWRCRERQQCSSSRRCRRIRRLPLLLLLLPPPAKAAAATAAVGQHQLAVTGSCIPSPAPAWHGPTIT
jgi:hypothetical protein